MKKLKIFIAAVALFFPALVVFAHATPLSYVPDASSVLQSAPAQISIRFSERVEPAASTITVYAPDGSRADKNDTKVDSIDPRLLRVSLADKGRGSYAVSWQVVSADDGHFTQGAYVFSVGAPSNNSAAPASSSFQVEHSSSLPEGTIIGIELVGEAALLGLLVVVVFVWRPMRRRHFVSALAEFDTVFLRRLNLILLSGFVLIIGGAARY